MFAPGETGKTVSVAVLDDAHDEGAETLTLTLSGASGADIADAQATGTIVNSGDMPLEWLGRFGRTVAEQVLEAVEGRFGATRTPGVEATLAGAGAPHALSGRDVLTGTSFTLTGGTPEGGHGAVWGRGAASRFDGREGALTVEGEVESAMVGADFTREVTTVGLMLAFSRGEGTYRGDGEGEVKSALTGLYPYGRYAVNERVTVWGVAGYGEGTLELTPRGAAAIETEMDLAMGAVGVRGVAREAPAGADSK